jgi:hypothetical protein
MVTKSIQVQRHLKAMKPILTSITTVTALVFSAAWLLGEQTAASAGQEAPTLTPSQAQQLQRDLVPHNSQDFFRQGQERIEREIQLLSESQRASSEPLLKINVNTQTPQDRLPLLQLYQFTQPSPEQ